MNASTASVPGDSKNPVDAAITSRRAVRAFVSTPVSKETVREILGTAGRAPSGTNIQPWRVYVLTGKRLRRLSEAILSVYNDPETAKTHTEEYAYYPKQWVAPYIERRRKIGWDLYGLLGITREDKDKMHRQHGRNYVFFDAPVGLGASQQASTRRALRAPLGSTENTSEYTTCSHRLFGPEVLGFVGAPEEKTNNNTTNNSTVF